MTRIEAANFLSNIRALQPKESDFANALYIAIKALEQEPCQDCISRAEAKRIVDYYIQFYDGQFRINESIDKLPSVQPIRPKGKWIYCYDGYECIVCHCREDEFSVFCPNCGAKMESEG